MHERLMEESAGEPALGLGAHRGAPAGTPNYQVRSTKNASVALQAPGVGPGRDPASQGGRPPRLPSFLLLLLLLLLEKACRAATAGRDGLVSGVLSGLQGMQGEGGAGRVWENTMVVGMLCETGGLGRWPAARTWKKVTTRIASERYVK